MRREEPRKRPQAKTGDAASQAGMVGIRNQAPSRRDLRHCTPARRHLNAIRGFRDGRREKSREAGGLCGLSVRILTARECWSFDTHQPAAPPTLMRDQRRQRTGPALGDGGLSPDMHTYRQIDTIHAKQKSRGPRDSIPETSAASHFSRLLNQRE